MSEQVEADATQVEASRKVEQEEEKVPQIVQEEVASPPDLGTAAGIMTFYGPEKRT